MTSNQIGLLTPSVGFKPVRYPWADQAWLQQQRIHWTFEEVSLGEDVRDWNTRLTAQEKNLLTQIFRFFTQADIDVADCYMFRYSNYFKALEVQHMLSVFGAMETMHVKAYALLVETVGMPDSEYKMFLEYKAMRDKHEYTQRFNMDNPREVLKTLAAFGAFTEGLQLYASFAMLLNFPRFGKMKGMGQIIAWSVRDESLHCEGIIKLFHTYAQETGALDKSLKEELRNICHEVVAIEDKFIDLAFELGEVEGMSPDEIKAYIRFVADWRLSQLGLEPLYGVKEHPLPWLKVLLNGVEHANFFETRATEYSKGATNGSWDETWSHFDNSRSLAAG